MEKKIIHRVKVSQGTKTLAPGYGASEWSTKFSLRHSDRENLKKLMLKHGVPSMSSMVRRLIDKAIKE